MNEIDIILEEYKRAFRKYAKDGVLDIDSRLTHHFDFQIFPLKEIVQGLTGIVPPTRQSKYLITLIEQGSGEKTIGHFTFPIHDNMLYIVPGRVIHSSRFTTLDCKGFVLSFNMDFFLQNAFPRHHLINKKILKTTLKPYLLLTSEQEKEIQKIFECISEEHHHTLPAKSEMIAVKILELLISCERIFSDEETKKGAHVYHDTIERFSELVEKNFTKERSVKFYADALYTHPNHLNYLVKKHTGRTAKDTITNRILSEAKYLLVSSSLTIKEIAFELGFDDPNYFSSFFRKTLNETPAGYRVQLI